MKKKNMVLVAALALLVGLVAYGTVAYFSGEAHVTNVITTGKSGSYTMILYGEKMEKTGYVATNHLTILSSGSTVGAGVTTQGYVTVLKDALLQNIKTGAYENVPKNLTVLLVSQDYTGYSIIMDANGVQYKVLSSNVVK